MRVPAPRRSASAAATARIPVRIFSVLIGGNTQARNFFRQMAEGTDGELFAAATANQVVQAVRVPVIGIGGIVRAMDALEFLIVGARAVQVGTAFGMDGQIVRPGFAIGL